MNEYFEDLLNPHRQSDNNTRSQNEDIKRTMLALKNNKVPGVDSMPGILFNYGGDGLVSTLYQLTIWETEVLPEEWRSVICPTCKKGDKLLCENYRDITSSVHSLKGTDNYNKKQIRKVYRKEHQPVKWEFKVPSSSIIILPCTINPNKYVAMQMILT